MTSTMQPEIRPRSSMLLRAVTAAYRKGFLPPRGTGQLFDRTPVSWWGGKDVFAKTKVGIMVVPLSDHGARQLLVFGEILHEKAETAFMRRLLPRLRTVLDVGAHYGWYAQLAGDLIPVDGHVIAAEANPHLIPYLRRNVGAGVEVLNAAVSSESGELTFYVSDKSGLSSSARQVGQPVMVTAVTLDEVAERRGLTVDFVKCDVEGGELAVLAGSRDIRSAGKPPIWMIEVDERFLAEIGSSYADVEREFCRYGPIGYYRATNEGALEPLNGGLVALRGTQQVNVIVVPAQRYEDVADLVTSSGRP